MSKTVFLLGGLVIVALLAGWAVSRRTSTTSVGGVSLPSPAEALPVETAFPPRAEATTTFGTPKKSAHFESSTPAHGAVLPAPPINVVIDVNFDLAAPSSLSILKDGKEYGVGPTTIDANKLALRRTLDPAAPDGVYTVTYRVCWPDRTCHDGQFQFAIDRSRAAAAQDLRSQSAVTVHLANIAFAPSLIRVRRGTTVQWVNDDTVEHYVNTDAHPAHTYVPAQNSRALKTGDTYSFTFAQAGAYPYHCSAHADRMTGLVLVE